MKKYTPEGKCYWNVFDYFEKRVSDGKSVSNMLLVHGVITAYEPILKKRMTFGHAWIEEMKETDDERGIWLVVDPAEDFNNPKVRTREWHYQAYKVDENKVKKYTWDDAYQFLLETDEYGQWNDELFPWYKEEAKKLEALLEWAYEGKDTLETI